MITYDNQWDGYPIITNKETNLGCETKNLNKIKETLNQTIEEHGNTVCVRMDPRYPVGYSAPEDNTHMKKFISKHVKHFKRQGYDPRYIWTREKDSSSNHHYHVAVFYKGCKGMKPNEFLKKADEHWDQTIGYESSDGKPSGLVDHCNKGDDGNLKRNAYWLRSKDPNFETVKKDCFKRLSYFAKTNTKSNCPKRVRKIARSKSPDK